VNGLLSYPGIYLNYTLQSFRKCGISNALDGSEDDILYEESDASSENNHEGDFSGSDTIFWVSTMNKLYYGC
jgi:hypothetical protein